MNTQVDFLGKHLSLASRAHRRWFVALIYSGFAMWIVAWISGSRVFGVLSLPFALASIVALAAVAGTGYEGGDEREVHRRDHVFFVAHRKLSWGLILLLLAAAFHCSNPVTSLVSPAFQVVLERMSYAVLFSFIALYATLPQSLILWTEPDMEEPK